MNDAVVRLQRGNALAVVVTLFKLRVVALLLLAAVGGAFLGAGGLPPTNALLGLLVTGGMAAAGASALNEYIERGSDARMRRTAQRPLAAGAIARPGWVPFVGLALIVAPVLVTLPFNPALALLVALGAAIYVGIYTLWLKPRTVANIVVGGAAGSCAVLSGGAAVGAWADPGVIVLALVIFAWTPAHFWSLALACREDYARAGLPMLPVNVPPGAAAFWILIHALAAGVAALVLSLHPALGLKYLAPTSLAAAILLRQGRGLLAQPTSVRAWRMFHISNLYLGVVLLAIIWAQF